MTFIQGARGINLSGDTEGNPMRPRGFGGPKGAVLLAPFLFAFSPTFNFDKIRKVLKAVLKRYALSGWEPGGGRSAGSICHSLSD